jgi:hypothetical protein
MLSGGEKIEELFTAIFKIFVARSYVDSMLYIFMNLLWYTDENYYSIILLKRSKTAIERICIFLMLPPF